MQKTLQIVHLRVFCGKDAGESKGSPLYSTTVLSGKMDTISIPRRHARVGAVKSGLLRGG